MSQAKQRERTITFEETGPADDGTTPDEVVIALSPGFGEISTETLSGVSHAEILRETMAGIEEEGASIRVVRVYDTVDLGRMGLISSNLSGSGISIAIQSRGTTLIHQEDLLQLDNLELFPQGPLLVPETFRAIGRNAARYAKGESPAPVTVENDPMTRPKFQAMAAIWHIKETERLDEARGQVELDVAFN
ncbi:propanediol/glycerol family dehydratase medium subunit [Halalkalicoccus jeotgali]|uniref:Dehydratase medium subunit n=1 Tax=Halalkalicoccus jeotgali (strain DSM 18796 / CECT 7217 / JCM 14584 / KCTC 4019 / B3) TaxID=795797 RepID=D8JB93_HALJB|nr:propanediol/glycerol family dehydratase medium subunit [Halalkalicoccus jeotgali]ADJ16546.1 dehydratase medium subunit [Halalkalicoccus jeotgali B3]ELY41358.1 propanediol dehydratase medium subunit [Halalkalicoccus jeotgali B3]